MNSTGDEVDDTITRSELKEALDSAIVSSIIMLLHFRLYLWENLDDALILRSKGL